MPEDFIFFFQAEDGIRDYKVTGVQTCALPICRDRRHARRPGGLSFGLPPAKKGPRIAGPFRCQRRFQPPSSCSPGMTKMLLPCVSKPGGAKRATGTWLCWMELTFHANVRPWLVKFTVSPQAILMGRSEEHTSELQSPCNIVCRLLLEKQ